MTTDQELELAAIILRGTGDAIDTHIRAVIARHSHDIARWCIVVAPAKGLPGVGPDAPGERQFLVTAVSRERAASAFEADFRGIAQTILVFPCEPGTFLVVVTCPEFTQLHARHIPAMRGVA